jgi:hypothetical protein
LGNTNVTNTNFTNALVNSTTSFDKSNITSAQRASFANRINQQIAITNNHNSLIYYNTCAMGNESTCLTWNENSVEIKPTNTNNYSLPSLTMYDRYFTKNTSKHIGDDFVGKTKWDAQSNVIS